MKNILFTFIITIITMTSCVSTYETVDTAGIETTVVTVNGITYYSTYSDDFILNGVPVIVIDGLYYYQYWDNHMHMWWHRPVPFGDFGRIRRNYHHNMYRGGIWNGNRYMRSHDYRPFSPNRNDNGRRNERRGHMNNNSGIRPNNHNGKTNLPYKNIRHNNNRRR